MKKILLWVLLALFFVTCLFSNPQSGALSELAIKSFDHLMESDTARSVFGLEEEEAVAVFGEKREANFV